MKHRHLLSLAFISLATAALSDEPLPGMRFDLMPVGCLIHTQHNDGQEWIDAFVGKKGRNYVTKTFKGPAKAGKLGRTVKTTTYNASGYMIRKDWAGGKWESFTPFSCFSVPGQCLYTYKNADGAVEKYVGAVERRGKRFVSSGGFAGSQPFNDNTFSLGPFNDIAQFTEGATRFQVIRYENCGIDS